MRPCEGVVVNVAVATDGNVEWFVEVVALIYQQPRSSLREEQRNIRSTRGVSGVGERFLQTIHPLSPDPDSVARGLFSAG